MALVVQISTYEELKKIIAESGKEYDREQIEAAYRLAEEKHREQKRSSGEPYIIHPLSVAAILVGLGMDSQSVMAGLLHDVVEDTDCTLEDIQKQFGKEVALLIDGVTKLGKIPYSSREELPPLGGEGVRVTVHYYGERLAFKGVRFSLGTDPETGQDYLRKNNEDGSITEEGGVPCV